MHDIPNRSADVLLEAEATLRTSGKWDAFRPPEGALFGPEPFCTHTPGVEQWQQWIFPPCMQIAEYGKPLPANSGMLVYAREQPRRENPPAGRLWSLIRCLVDLLSIRSGAQRH